MNKISENILLHNKDWNNKSHWGICFPCVFYDK